MTSFSILFIMNANVAVKCKDFIQSLCVAVATYAPCFYIQAAMMR